MYLRKPVRERFVNIGKERRWFDKPGLCSKIEEVKRAVKSQGASNRILKNSKTVCVNIEDEVIYVDESNTSFDIIDNGSDNGDDEIDEDDFDCGAVNEDPIGSFSDLNPDSSGEIDHGTNLDISKRKKNSLSNKTDLLDGEIEEHLNGSEISEEYQAEEFSSHSKRENSGSDDNGQTGSNDDDDEEDDGDTNDNKSYAYKDLQCRSVEGEAHAVKSDSESDSSVELSRPRFRRTHKSNFIEVISISDSPVQSSEASCTTQSSSHNMNVIEDISISAYSPIKTSEVSSVEKSCSHSDSEEYFDNLNDRIGDVDASIDDKCFDDSYEIQQEPDRLTPLFVNSHEVRGDDESNLSSESTSIKSRIDHSNNNFEDMIISSPVNPNKISSVAESCSHEEYSDDNGHVDNDQEDDNDDRDDEGDDDEDIMYSDAEQEPDHSTPLLVHSNERDGNSESDLSAELTSPKSSNVIEDINIADSPIKTREESPSRELGSLINNEEYCDNGDGNNEYDDADNNDDDDANEDVRNERTEQDPHHLASFLVKSNEIHGDSGSDVSTYLIHPPESRSDHSRSEYSNTCNFIEHVSVPTSPVKTSEMSAVEECYSHNNSKRCSDDEDDSAGQNAIDHDYETEDDVIENIKDNEEESVDLAPLLVNSHQVNGDAESNLSTESICRPKSSMNNNDSNGTEDTSFPDSPLKSSLSARLFKKYNPEKSASDVDDFELFLQKIRTPKLSKLSDERKEREESVNGFIVDDDDDDQDDQEDDVFFDPWFIPELEEISDEDQENKDIEIATPATSSTRFKTPASTTSSTRFETPASRVLSNHSSRPKSILDNILVAYATEKEFKKSKDKLVKDLFELYNRTVFDNQMPSDFQITWNPRMRSTAGFCYYSKKNGVRVARIELADKVIDCADRLRDTLIHEMCHAAAWLISGVKAGHGAVWKKWTLRANSVHQDLPPISRCHSYTINAKYTYRCTNNNCANTFGRHSKSVNLEKSRCAYCHSRLELVPQLKKDGTPQTRTPSKFALFVKQNYARIKSDHDRFSHQDVMKALSSEFAKVSTS